MKLTQPKGFPEMVDAEAARLAQAQYGVSVSDLTTEQLCAIVIQASKNIWDAEAARLLGFDPSVNFVTVEPDGSIGFTSGKPDELRALYARVMIARLEPSPGLIRAVVAEDSRAYPWSREYVELTYPRAGEVKGT